ncbi:MAG: hypothetical protein KatS3mg105_0848 [Gemmatales bacterium]|nr:MAG: hypothetical protein KatS3mg105_0848 [Gemmatales bacterium]
MQSFLKRRLRRLQANFIYLKRPIVEFLPLFTGMVIILFCGGFAFHKLYEKQQLTFGQALYITYCLIFMEHLVDFPDHWLLQAFYFLLPPLGLVVILDGLIRFGYHVLRHDESGNQWMRAMALTYRNHVILCGLGRVGLRVLQQLHLLGEDVVVLEKDPHNQNIAYAKKHGFPVLIGTGREEGILEDLNVAHAKSIIVATDNDLANLEIALDARKIKPHIRVVMRMFDQELASKIRESFGIHQAFSTAAQAAPLFACSSSDRSIINSFYVDSRLLVVARLTIRPNSELIGKRIRDIGAAKQTFFLAHTRQGIVTHFPPADTDLQQGDIVVVQTEPNNLKTLHQWNRDQESDDDGPP